MKGAENAGDFSPAIGMTADPKVEQEPGTPILNAVHQQPQEALELVAAGPDQKNWRGIGIALLVIVAVCALIVTAIVLLTPGDKNQNLKKSRIRLEEVVKGFYNYRRFNGTWISDHEFLYQDGFSGISIYDVINGSSQVLVSNTTVRQHLVSQFSLSPDRQYMLLAHKQKRIFRYTYEAAFMIYNLSNDYLAPLIPSSENLMLQYASWGPTGNQLVYVLNNNIYYLSDVTAKPRQLTSSGSEGIIYNGIPDWVYEEEVLSSDNAMWWTDDGSKLCFASFNDSDVDELKYPKYGDYDDIHNVYPKMMTLKYPKAGKVNPTISLWISDLNSPKEPQRIQPPKEYRDVDYYFTSAQWFDASTVAVIWLRRSQNSTTISLCRENDGWVCSKNLQEDSRGYGWVEITGKPVVSADKKYYFLRLPGPPEGAAGRFKHIAAIDIKTGSKSFLTSGEYDVTSILAHSMSEKTVYYITTLEGKPGQRHLFGVTDLTHTSPKTTTCYTCDLGEECLYNNAQFSPDLTYYTLECLGPGIPRTEIRAIENNKLVTVLDTNENLRLFVGMKALPRVKNLQVPIDGNYYALVRLFLPPSLQEYEITKYPMLIEVYGGPGSQMITEKFNVNWGSYLASAKNIIYVWIDGRGSGNRGDKILHEVYRRLGTVEVFDQLSVTKYLKDKYHFIDDKRVAIFGWSYGGYASAMALANDDNVFSCGISVAPVTSWLYYDSVYTERYMQSPAKNDNLVNYEKSDVMKRAKNFKNKKYLLVHGTADDNVHWQQSMMLVKALTDAGIMYRMQVYPDESHGLSHVKLHLYHTMNDFLDHCFSDNPKDVLHSLSSDPER